MQKYISTFVNNSNLHPNRFRPPGLFVTESNVLHQEDGGALPGGGSAGHPEPPPDNQLQSEVPHLTQCGCFSRLVLWFWRLALVYCLQCLADDSSVLLPQSVFLLRFKAHQKFEKSTVDLKPLALCGALVWYDVSLFPDILHGTVKHCECVLFPETHNM